MSNEPKTWVLMLDKSLDVSRMPIRETVENLEVSEKGDSQGGRLQPVVFAAVISDGMSFFCNTVKEKENGNSLIRLHLPISPETTSRVQPSDVQMIDGIGTAVSLKIESYFKSITWDGKSLLSDCLSVQWGDGSNIFELQDDDSTAIIPLTVSLRKSTSIIIEDDRVRKIIIDDLLSAISEDIEAWEIFSFQLVEEIAIGGIHLPAEPFSIDADIEELLNYGEEDGNYGL
jgi:hypothetical protein